MKRSVVRIATCAAVGAALLAPGSAQAAPTRLTATVGPGFTITLKNTAGKKVVSLKAGAYTIVVRDLGSTHNFHLTGLGVNKRTGVPFKGNMIWAVKLRKGVYKYVCDPHAFSMKGAFKVV